MSSIHRSVLLLLLSFLSVTSASLAALPFPAPKKPATSGKTCTVTPLGANHDDVPQILEAFASCNGGGTVAFAAGATYNIATRLHATVRDVVVEWRGTWRFSDNLTYWRENSYPIEFQNHRAGFVLSGERIHVNGYGTGGIDGNGDAWYTAEKGDTKEGRPMPFVLWNVSEVVVEHCTLPPFSPISPGGDGAWRGDCSSEVRSFRQTAATVGH
jgi:galacturan 1,4-alpha-galacturonidase